MRLKARGKRLGLSLGNTLLEAGLNVPKEVFVEMLDDLGVKNLRLSAYWEEVESINNNFYY